MKAQIHISGQTSGNFELVRKMRNYTHRTDSRFNSFVLHYNSIAEAKNDIKEAYKMICDEQPEMKGKIAGIRKYNDNSALYYDASKAEIVLPE